jgi:DNA-binding PadR family transcriptional regulator
MHPTPEISACLPLTEVTYFILLSLDLGPRHGYLIMKEVRGLSRDRVNLSTGTLYGALKRMLEVGWVQRIDGEEEMNSRRIRKAYRITETGRYLLSAEIQRLETLVGAARLHQAREAS